VRIVAIAGLAVLTLAGCASSGPKRPEWTKPGATDAQLQAEKYDCMQRHAYNRPTGILGPKMDENLYRQCMRARGWVHEGD
jgi:hypothetical protein